MEKRARRWEYNLTYWWEYDGIKEGEEENEFGNHYSADLIIKKIMDEDAVSMVGWTHNANVNKNEHTLLTSATGKSVIFPGISGKGLWIEKLW